MQKLEKHFKDVNQKVADIQYNLKEDVFDINSYRLVFRKILDGYNPDSESFLLTDYCFKGLYLLRETLSQ